MTTKQSPKSPPKKRLDSVLSDDFESVAKRLECEDDKEAFEKKLGKIAKAKPEKKRS